jgi:hypothetical protein
LRMKTEVQVVGMANVKAALWVLKDVSPIHYRILCRSPKMVRETGL